MMGSQITQLVETYNYNNIEWNSRELFSTLSFQCLTMQYTGKSQFPMLNNAIHGQVIKNLLSFNPRQQDWDNLEILFGPKPFVILD